MKFSPEETKETASMTLFHDFDIRTATLGINLKDCVESDFDEMKQNIYEKIKINSEKLIEEAEKLEDKYGIPIINKRVSITPISLVMENHAEKDKFVEMAETIDQAAADAGIDFIGGFGCLAHKGTTKADEVLLKSLPAVLENTERVCCFANVGEHKTGLDIDSINLIGKKIKEISERTEDSIGCAKLCVFVNAPEDNPFMAGAFHGPGEPDLSLNIGISGPGVLKNVIEENPEADMTELSEIIKRTTFKTTRAGEKIGRDLSKNLESEFGIVDIACAPSPAEDDSIAKVLEEMGVEEAGAPGTTAAVALLIDSIKKGGAMASGNVGGLSGTFIPVSEDMGMVDSVEKDALSLEKLEALTAVCSVGMDMVVVPGNTSAKKLSAIIADELSIGLVNNKAESVRIIPVEGKEAGEYVEWGGLLGEAPVMEVNQYGSEDFLDRGGRMPSPLRSLRN